MYAPVMKHRYKYSTAMYFNVNSNGGDADSGYNDSYHVGVVVLMPCLVHGLGEEKICLEYALLHTEAWSFRYKISSFWKAYYLEYLLSRRCN